MLDPDCSSCSPGYYNNDQENSHTECILCPTSYPPITGKTPDNTVQQTNGQSECPWKCLTGYYKDNGNCESCPSGSTSEEGSDGIEDCTCPNNEHILQSTSGYYCGTCTDSQYYGDDADATHTPFSCECAEGAGMVSCQCPFTSTYNPTTNSCDCKTTTPKRTLNPETNIVTCSACPEHSQYNANTNTCVCASGADNCVCSHNSVYNATTNACECTQTPYLSGSTANGYLECSACPEHATYNNGCKCIKGYYNSSTDSNTVSCTACPAGSTTLDTENTPEGIGAQSKTACKMNSSTLFCDSRGQNCMNLIPNGVEISASAN